VTTKTQRLIGIRAFEIPRNGETESYWDISCEMPSMAYASRGSCGVSLKASHLTPP
jgi:hypothetical protein